jgi:hypothetical protein
VALCLSGNAFHGSLVTFTLPLRVRSIDFHRKNVYFCKLMPVFKHFSGCGSARLERLVRDDVKTAFLAQNQQKPFKFFSQIVHF